jgi:hypothetical protein
MASKRMGKESGSNVPIQKMETVEAGIFEYHDKMLKRDYMKKEYV